MIARIVATMIIEITDVKVVFESEGIEAQCSIQRLALPAVSADGSTLGPVFKRHVALDGLFIRVGNSQLLEPTGMGVDLLTSSSNFGVIRCVPQTTMVRPSSRPFSPCTPRTTIARLAN